MLVSATNPMLRPENTNISPEAWFVLSAARHIKALVLTPHPLKEMNLMILS